MQEKEIFEFPVYNIGKMKMTVILHGLHPSLDYDVLVLWASPTVTVDWARVADKKHRRRQSMKIKRSDVLVMQNNKMIVIGDHGFFFRSVFLAAMHESNNRIGLSFLLFGLLFDYRHHDHHQHLHHKRKRNTETRKRINFKSI